MVGRRLQDSLVPPYKTVRCHAEPTHYMGAPTCDPKWSSADECK
jgi:hypothetical protein